MDDWELLNEYRRNRSQDAFTRLVERHVGLVYHACRVRLRDEHLAEDVTQAVFVLLARRGPQFIASSTLSGWLYRTAMHACSNLERSRLRRQHHERGAALVRRESIARQDCTSASELILDRAIARLSERDRDLILMRFYEDRDVEQIASVLGIATNTAAKRLSRALERLRGYCPSDLAGAWPLAMLRQPAPPGLASKASSALAHSLAAPSVESIAKGVIQAMIHVKLQVLAASVGFVVLGVGGALLSVWPLLRADSNAIGPDRALAAPAGDDGKAEFVISDTRMQEFEARSFLFARHSTTLAEFDLVWKVMQKFEPAYPQIGEKIRGNMMVVCPEFRDDADRPLEVEVGHPVTEDCTAPDGTELELRVLPAIRCASIIYSGPLRHIAAAEQQLTADMQKLGLEPTGERRHQRLLWEDPESPNNVVLLMAGVK